ncbi:MAG: DUF3592 domain-containing protein [Silvanigrellaceae bacterium]|nr:DUF3592 domain-containing protein [Silvanigrellaceae bacterium]
MKIDWLISWHSFIDFAWLAGLIILLVYFYKDWKVFKNLHQWQTTEGTISQFSWTEQSPLPWPKIEYTYQVYEQEFLGSRLVLDNPYINLHSPSAREVAYRATLAFKNDEEIIVFYDPINPAQSVLDVHTPRKLKVIIGMLVLFLTIHLFRMGYRFLGA